MNNIIYYDRTGNVKLNNIKNKITNSNFKYDELKYLLKNFDVSKDLEFLVENLCQELWIIVSQYQKLSEEFIEKYSDKLNWKLISKYQKLSEQFIEKYVDKLDWKLISEYQKLSGEFIRKFSNAKISREELFNSVIKNVYNWLRWKISTYLPKMFVDDSLHDAIEAFYRYYYKRFNMKYEYFDIVKAASQYFIKHVFQYLSKKSFYGKKIQQSIKKRNEQYDNDSTRLQDQIFYASGSTDNVSQMKKYNVDLSILYDNANIDNKIYLDEFSKFIAEYDINEKTKNLLILFIKTKDSSIFKTNLAYYKKKYYELSEEFNS